MKVRQVFITFLLIVMIGTAAAAEEEPRLALVIGNSDYQHFGALKNPVNDARDISEALEELGFEVVTVLNADYQTLFKEIRYFGEKLAKDPGVGLFYYAGHAIEAGGVNYLIPTNADIRAQDEVEFASVAVDLVLSKMETADNPTNIIVLDSCRDNPLPETARGAGGSRGLTVVEAPQGSLIVYATEPGSTAADGRGRNSPFTEAFLKHLPSPDLDIELMLRNVRRDVIAATGGKQTPWTNSSLVKPVVLAGGGAGITVGSGSSAAVHIKRTVGSLEIKTRDPGDLYIDGEYVASLRKDERVTLQNIPAGSRELEMRFKDHREERSVTLDENEKQEISFTYESEPRFKLTVDPGLDGLQVTVDRVNIGRTPLEVELPAGKHSIELTGPFIEGVREQIDGASRSTVRFDPELTRLGMVSISGTIPPGSIITLNGDAAAFDGGRAYIPVGTHQLSINHPTLKKNAKTVTVSYGRSVTVEPELRYRMGSVAVTDIPDSTEIMFQNKKISPDEAGRVIIDEVIVGRHTLMCKNDYGVETLISVTVQEDKSAETRPPAGTITFSGFSGSQSIYLNDMEVPKQSTFELLAGSYQVTASGKYLDRISREVEVEAGKAVQVNFAKMEIGDLTLKRTGFLEEMESARSRRKKLAAGGWISIGTGVLGAGTAVLGYILGKNAYTDYRAAENPDAALSARNRVETAGLLLSIGSGVGGVGISTGTLLFLFGPKPKRVQSRIHEIDTQIRTLENVQ
jgi:hypothetical protein